VPDEQLVSVNHAARLLGISRQRVHGLVNSGKLPGQKFEGRIFIPLSAIEARKRDHGLSVRDIARALGVTRDTVRDWHKRGILQGGVMTPQRQLRFPADALETFERPIPSLPASRQPYSRTQRKPNRKGTT